MLLLIALMACGPKSSDVAETPIVEEAIVFQSCPEGRPPEFDRIASLLEEQVMGTSEAPGFVVSVVQDGQLVWCEGFGERSPVDDTPMGPRTLLRVGSTTKQFTTASVMQQVDAGLLTVDDTVDDVLGGWSFAYNPGEAEKVTVHQLMTHQGGFYDYIELDAVGGKKALGDFVEDFLPNNVHMMAPAGTLHSYSNPNFYVAGYLAELLADAPYNDVVEQDLFAPLGMHRTLFSADDVLADGDFAEGYSAVWASTMGTTTMGPETYDNRWGGPAGFAWSSGEDMANWALFLMEGDSGVLSDASREAMMSSQVSTTGYSAQGYGYGLFVDQGLWVDDGWIDLPSPLVHHGGDIAGFASDFYMMPEQGMAIAMIANADYAHMTGVLEEVLGQLVDLPEPGELPTELEPATDLARYAGVYQDPFNVGTLVIGDAGTEISVDAPALTAANVPFDTTMIPYSGDSFVWGIQGTYILVRFVDDDSGQPHWVTNRAFVAEREGQTGTTVGSLRLDPNVRELPIFDLRTNLEQRTATE